MTKINKGTKKYDAIMWTFKNAFKGHTIFDAYTSPSQKKVSSFLEIENRAKNTAGYNHDLKISAAGCQNYSTIYSYTENNTTFIIYDTKSNTFVIEV